MINDEMDGWRAFLKPILAPYELDPRVSIYLIGRAAKCTFSERGALNDIDLLVIGENFGEPCVREVTTQQEQTYDITYVRAASVRDMVTSKHAMWIEILAHSKLLQSNGGVGFEAVEKATHLWESGPGLPDQGMVKRIRFECGQLIENLERNVNEPLQFSYIMSCSVSRLVVLYFELTGQWLPKPKKQMAALQRLNAELYDLLATTLTAQGSHEKMAKFRILVERMLDEHGGIMSGFSKGTYPIDL